MDVSSRLLSIRICAGRHLAQDTLSLMFASILHVYTIEPLVEGITAMKFTSNFISYVLSVSVLSLAYRVSLLHACSVPEDLPYRFKVRNAAALALAEDEEGV